MSSQMSWTEFLKNRVKRNRIRPIGGVPGFMVGLGCVLTQVSFSPFDPILGIDPAFVYGFGSLLAGAAGYQGGAVLGTALWRLANKSILPQMDKMDKIFYQRINYYRAERGQSPYVNTMANTGSMLRTALKSPTQIAQKNNEFALTRDFYGEKIKSIADYRHWLRRQRKFDKDLGQLKPIRREEFKG